MTPTERVEHAEREVTRYGRRVWTGLLVVVLAVIVAALGYTHHQVGAVDDRAAAERAANGRTITAQQQAIRTLSTQVRRLGGTPAAVPTSTAPAQQQVDVGTVVAQVLAAIPPPRDGRTPTGPEVERAVEAVCARMGCGPTQQQLASTVAAYVIAHPPADGRDGKDGVDGQNGRDGVDGVGVADARMTQDGDTCTLVLVLTNGREIPVPWQCQASPTPTPTPTPTPAPSPGLPILGGR